MTKAFLLSGYVRALSQLGNSFERLDVKSGEFVQIPGGAKHGFRNTSNEPAVQLITTTPRLGMFFQEGEDSSHMGLLYLHLRLTT